MIEYLTVDWGNLATGPIQTYSPYFYLVLADKQYLAKVKGTEVSETSYGNKSTPKEKSLILNKHLTGHNLLSAFDLYDVTTYTKEEVDHIAVTNRWEAFGNPVDLDKEMARYRLYYQEVICYRHELYHNHELVASFSQNLSSQSLIRPFTLSLEWMNNGYRLETHTEKRVGYAHLDMEVHTLTLPEKRLYAFGFIPLKRFPTQTISYASIGGWETYDEEQRPNLRNIDNYCSCFLLPSLRLACSEN